MVICLEQNAGGLLIVRFYCYPVFIKIQNDLLLLMLAYSYPSCPGKEAIKRVLLFLRMVDRFIGTVTDKCHMQ